MSWALETQGLGFFCLPPCHSFLSSSASSLLSSLPSHVLLLSHSFPRMPWLWPDSSSGLSPACPIGSSVNAGSLKRQGRAWGWSPWLILALLAPQLTTSNPSDPQLSSIARTTLSSSVWSQCIYCLCDGIWFLKAQWNASTHKKKHQGRIYYCTILSIHIAYSFWCIFHTYIKWIVCATVCLVVNVLVCRFCYKEVMLGNGKSMSRACSKFINTYQKTWTTSLHQAQFLPHQI